MAPSRLLIVLFMLAAVGFINGAEKEGCEGLYTTNLQTKICKTKETPKDIQEKIMQELKNNPSLKSFKQDPIEEDDYSKVTGDATNNCMAETRIEVPYVIQVNNSMHYVVQDQDLFHQRIKVTKCLNLNNSCFGSIYSKGNDNIVETHCREKTGAVSVYVYSTEKKKIVYKSFELPVCCTCMLKKK